MCDITFAHQSKSLMHILVSLPVIPRRPQTNSLKCQVCWRVNKPKLEWQQINGAPCPLLIMSWIHIQGLTNKTGLHKWATAVWSQQQLQIRLKVPCYAHSFILQGYWNMFTLFHVGKTHYVSHTVHWSDTPIYPRFERLVLVPVSLKLLQSSVCSDSSALTGLSSTAHCVWGVCGWGK